MHISNVLYELLSGGVFINGKNQAKLSPLIEGNVRMATPPPPLSRIDLEKTLFYRFFVVKGFVALRASPILHQIDLIGCCTLWTACSG